ncbi:hypothetical protein [Bacteroides sp. GM023]|uniref:hypothetical protein n=1 Tax=Bacteroides sp. GM023 TaxID=2723058 RepID=UPI00168BEADC|nr:hypothetical protein [Bacteroides sp. GM023]MBD3589114.1 hypothetical protein [Bacteroides sp. GM023]
MQTEVLFRTNGASVLSKLSLCSSSPLPVFPKRLIWYYKRSGMANSIQMRPDTSTVFGNRRREL